MNIVILFLICMMSMMISSCCKIEDHEVLADKKIFNFAKEVRKTDGLELWMYGGGLYERINSLNIGFISTEYVDIDESRMIYIDLLERFLDSVNSDMTIRKYLATYPFTKDEVNLVLQFEPPLNKQGAPFVSSVSMGPMYLPQRNSIFYHQMDPLTGESEIVLEENYDKALDILKFQQCQREMDAEMQTPPSF